MLLSIACVALSASGALADHVTAQEAAAATVYVNALGMGVGNKAKSTSFYTTTLGIKKGMSMPVPNMGQGGWTEDINTFSGAHSSALVIMEWTDRRNYKNLPVKITMSVKDPQARQALIAKSGGQAVQMKTEATPDAIYAKDPDGFLIELVPGEDPPAMKSISVGVSNLNASLAWWAGATGMEKGAIKSAKEWDVGCLSASKGSQLCFMDWHETPKRQTKNMPIKIVLAASSTSELTRSIQRQSPKGSQAGTIGMFQWEPLERTLIEVNGASGGGGGKSKGKGSSKLREQI